MKVDKTAATLIASMGGVLIGGAAVGVLMISGSGGSSHTPNPVQTIAPAAEQQTTSTLPVPTSTTVTPTRVTLKVPAKTQAAPKVQVATPNEETTPVSEPSEAPPADPTTPDETPATSSAPHPPSNGGPSSALAPAPGESTSP